MIEDVKNDSDADDLAYAIKQLFFWQYNQCKSDNFSSLLYNLFQKADLGNLQKLTRGFPHEAQALKMWKAAPNDIEFFKSFGHAR